MNKISKEELASIEKSGKLGIVGTIDNIGDPHLTLLTTLMPCSESEMVIGQYSKGSSMVNMRERIKCGFSIFGADLSYWCGTMDFKYSKTDGPEHTKYNNMPMWRFNTYFGIYEVYYFDLVNITEKAVLDVASIGAHAEISGGGAAGQSGIFYHVLEFRCNHGGNPFGAVRVCGPGCLGAGQASAAQGPGQSLYGADAAALSGAHVSGIPGTARPWPAGYPLGSDPARNFLCLPCLPAYKVLCGNSGGNSGGGTAGRGRGMADFSPHCPAYGAAGPVECGNLELSGCLESD